MRVNEIPIGTKYYVQYWNEVKIITVKSKLEKSVGKKGESILCDVWHYKIHGDHLGPHGLKEKEQRFSKSAMNNIKNTFQLLYYKGWDKALQRRLFAVILEQNGNLI